jgi:type IV pilus assembly protein PilM
MKSSILSAAKAKIGTRTSGRPPAAVELSPEGVIAAAAPALGEPLYAYAALPAGALAPNLESSSDAPNVRQSNVVAEAIRTALDEVKPRKHAVTLVLPDTLVRVFVLDFDSFPAKTDEAIPVLRFRLRKMVPFDVEHASLSYQVLSQSEEQTRVLAAILPGPVLAEYESAVRAAGYEPGAVLPSSIAALEAIDSMEAVLTANLSQQALTTTIANGQDLLLYRTLDLPENPEDRVGEIQRGIAVAAAYYEDKLQVRPQRLFYTGNAAANDFARWLNDPELEVVELAPRPESGVMTSLGTASIAGVAGALAVHSNNARRGEKAVA